MLRTGSEIRAVLSRGSRGGARGHCVSTRGRKRTVPPAAPSSDQGRRRPLAANPGARDHDQARRTGAARLPRRGRGRAARRARLRVRRGSRYRRDGSERPRRGHDRLPRGRRARPRGLGQPAVPAARSARRRCWPRHCSRGTPPQAARWGSASRRCSSTRRSPPPRSPSSAAAMPRTYVGLGSTWATRSACSGRGDMLAFNAEVEVMAMSTIRETDPVGIVDQPRS